MRIDKNVNANMDREPISISGKCNWCNERSAVITDGTYVYCSNNCKKEFMEDALKAIEEANENR
jgi:YHS domain-containing protein